MATYNVLVGSTAILLFTAAPGAAYTIQNYSGPPGQAVGPQNVNIYLGPSSSVTTSNGVPLTPGSRVAWYGLASLKPVPAIYAICPAGQTCYVSINATVS